MNTLKQKRVLVYDGGGLFVSLAEVLARSKQFAQVDFFREWQDSFTDGRELLIGAGLSDFGVNRVKYFWNEVKNYDLIVFPDCWQADLQEYLRAQGMRVWGAGKKASLELSRWGTKGQMKEVGLPVNPAEQIHGLENLRVYLREHPGVFVKVSGFRGLGETFESENYDLSKGQLDQLRAKHGAMMDVIDFIVEKKIPDATENGYDGYCIDGEFPNQSFWGVEVKDQAYAGKLVKYDDLPKEVQEVNTKLSPLMNGYRQFWSTELRNEFLIDITARHASPAGETYIHAYDNLPEILWYGAEGRLIQPETEYTHCAQIILCSEWAEHNYFPIQFPEEIRPFVKIYNHARISGVDYCVPQIAAMKQVGSVIGLGSSFEEAAAQAKERADQIKGYDLEAENDALDKAIKLMEESE